MPNYRYKCECGYEDSFFLKMSHDPDEPIACPDCPGVMHRIISKPRVVFERDTLGKWYKENTGKDLLGD